MSSPDLTKLVKGTKIRVKDGEILAVRGSYMSTTGLVITASKAGQVCDRNVPVADITEILEN